MKVRIKEYYGNDISDFYIGKIGTYKELRFPNHVVILDDGTRLTFVEDESMRIGRHIEEITE